VPQWQHRVEVINTVDKARVRAKEGVHCGFGFNVPDGVMHLDVPWGVVRPELDQIPGACRNWFTVQRWVDVSNAPCIFDFVVKCLDSARSSSAGKAFSISASGFSPNSTASAIGSTRYSVCPS